MNFIFSIYINIVMYDIDFGYNDIKELNRFGVERFMVCLNCNCILLCK